MEDSGLVASCGSGEGGGARGGVSSLGRKALDGVTGGERGVSKRRREWTDLTVNNNADNWEDLDCWLASSNPTGNVIGEIARKTGQSSIVISLLDSNLLIVSAMKTSLKEQQKDA